MEVLCNMPLSTMLYIAVLVLFVGSIVLSITLKTTFKKLSGKHNMRGIDGKTAAQIILQRNDINDVSITFTQGTLSDHYHPARKTVALSDGVYDSSSVAAVAIAAHECGHAIQHHTKFFPLVFRNFMVPVANLGSNAGYFLFFIGLFLARSELLMNIGIVLFSAAVIFHFLTLPVEFNASKRGLKALEESGILYEEEFPDAKKMLGLAACTYVASAAMSLLQLLRLIAIKNNR